MSSKSNVLIMCNFSMILFISIVINFLVRCSGKSLSTDIPNLILISMDGFRYDYLNHMEKESITNFTYFIQNGVTATEGVLNVFPANTYPNHYSIITGLYPESHGVVNNYFYDPYLQNSFSMMDLSQNFESKWFDVGGEPITVTNMKQSNKRNSGSALWPASLAPVECKQPLIIPNECWFTKTVTWKNRVDTLIDWFSTKNGQIPINLGLLYFEEPDEQGHHTGPDSAELKEKIKELDSILGYLRKKLEEHHLSDTMNIIITADHGMVSFGEDYLNKTVVIDELLDPDWFVFKQNDFHTGIAPQIRVMKGHEDDVTRVLFPDGKNEHKGFYAWHKSDKELVNRHYSHSTRIMEIVLEAKLTWRFVTKNYIVRAGATHGYDPNKYQEMHPFFIASGPAFKKNHKIKSLDMVDIYPLMCHILGLSPAPNNGSLTKVSGLLLHPPKVWYKSMETTAVSFLGVIFLAALVGGVFGIAACRQNRIHRRKALMKNRIRGKHSPLRSMTMPEADSMLRDNSETEEEF